jgi:uncharacterized protein (DUF983 family)
MKVTPVPYDSLTRWQPDRTPDLPQWPLPKLSVALLRGACNRCPACGETKLFLGYLKVSPQCAHCGAPLGLARADDAPPYFTILIVGHIVVPLMYWLERARQPPLWVHAAIWLPLTLVLCLGLLRPIKGATVGLMLKLGLLKTDIDDR